jgi:hypothetical protein
VQALGACPHLEAVEFEADGFLCQGLLTLLTRAVPGLTKLVLRPQTEFTPPPAALLLPWPQLRELHVGRAVPLLVQVLEERTGGLASLRALTTTGDSEDLAAVWSAPWLPQLTSLWLRGEPAGVTVAAGMPAEGRFLPALQELTLGWGSHGGMFTPACAARLATCRMPALRALRVDRVEPGALAPLLAAAWANNLRSLHVCSSAQPDWCGSAGVAALARATALEHLSFTCMTGTLDRDTTNLSLDSAALATLLSAPWAATLQGLSLSGQVLGSGPKGDAAVRVLAAARLPRLHACSLINTQLTAASLEVLGSAAWLQGLTALTLSDNPGLGSCLSRLAGFDLASLRAFELEDYHGTDGKELATLAARSPWLVMLEHLRINVRAAPGDSDIVIWAQGARRAVSHRDLCSMALGARGPFAACRERGADISLYVS